ncbi:KH domain-containing, RNA-binding, signal transduction-associated protein 2 isoform X3 [Perognathus longimembris pacificus]|uniref:KH domain-containing, RNA-binding, signal transduction-associated protein 2 isoform X3 n=1 Tax=Perognathus longimembris pacificus TaxID=214514 RepID=UPI002018AAB2|nr:KH domain-containing, RNA-binding, signal transduction-associated protein 2 isoform X3 [Perognathus longimembris pacificus]
MEEEKYLPELMAEKDSLDPSFVHASRLLAEEIEKFQGSDGKKEEEEKKYLDVISNKNIKLSERVLIPVKQYPKEEELRKSGEAKYAHLSDELHVLIEVFAPPGEAYSRMSHALEEIKKFLVPDYNDEIRQEQLRELSYLNGSEDSGHGRGIRGRGIRIASTTPSRGRGGAVPPPPPPGRGVLTPRGTTVTRGALPVPPVARGVSAPRARGTSSAPGYRALPHPVPEAYEEYAYDDGYVGDYEDQAYEAYDSSYATQTQSVAEYYDYGHGVSEDIYDSYAPEEWATSRSSLKAPPPRSARGGYREHPYGRY